ncbi:hypothetical protein Acr_22g0009200 [Actinidia rufa]|uniref:Uncharacterized protein n=1 Tax=Actinidia rufa TaxID=165716 RepID=A0A7J0GL84_9ERIC|nr:hypothetical protein Acr_22g0009200 [Actinidia rufa]
MAVPVPSRIQAAHQMALPVPSVPSPVQASHSVSRSSISSGFIDSNVTSLEKRNRGRFFGRATEKTRYFFVKLKKKGKSVDGSKLCSNRWQRKKEDGKKQNEPFDMEAHSRCQGIGGNQDGEGVSSMSCAENSILGRKRPRIEFMMDYELPNLSVADAAIMVESIDKERDHCMDRLGAENCVSALSEGISKSFTQDDDAEFLRGLSPIFKKFSDEGFGGRLWTESEAEQMGDPQESLRDLEINSEMFC